MKYIPCVVIAVLLFMKTVVAQEYFVFQPDKKHVYQDDGFEVEFFYNFDGYEEADFLVRPVMSRGTAKIYNQKSNIWVAQNGLWTSMPALEKNMRLKTLLVGEAEIYFELQNIINHKIYTTSKEKIWGGNIFNHYIDRINDNIKRHRGVVEVVEVVPERSTAADNKTAEPPSLLAKMLKYIDEII